MTSSVDGTWRLLHGAEPAADMTVVSADFPFLNASVVFHPAFDALAPLFSQELLLIEDDAAWDAAYQQIREATTLLYPDGRPVPEYLLHIDGAEAWWRWSDEPFEA